MITIEDVTEEIVGEIEDEYDVNQNLIEKIKENEYNVLARIDVLSLNKDLDIELPESDEYETLAGFVLNYFENIPEVNDEIVYERFKITIKEVDDRSVIKVNIKLFN